VTLSSPEPLSSDILNRYKKVSGQLKRNCGLLRALKLGGGYERLLLRLALPVGSNDVSTGLHPSPIRPSPDLSLIHSPLRCGRLILPIFHTMASASRSATMASSSIMSMLRPRMMQARSTRFSPLQAQIRQLSMRPTRALRRTHVSLNCTYTGVQEFFAN
jgi:hypothetical protein